MPNRRSYKTDESFLEKISIGAIGTQKVFNNLAQQEHTPIELERGSMSFKIWKAIKIKRIRVPDILCIACNHRVESRAKTNLEISMSHSFSDPQRGWDYGLENEDYVAFVVCYRTGERPIDWQASDLVQYVSVKEMCTAQHSNLALNVQAKGAQEGFEARITWPSCVAKAEGTVTRVNETQLQYRRRPDDRPVTLRLSRGGMPLQPLVSVGQFIETNQVLASVVPVTQSFLCPKTATEQDYARGLSSSSQSERYAAAKALSYFNTTTATRALSGKVDDTKDHIYVRLEAAASLSRRGDERGSDFIKNCLSDQYLENGLEAVIILAEVGNEVASRLLISTLQNSEQHPEIRAGAAWALGQMRDKSALEALIGSFIAVEAGIRTEAARALAKLGSQFTLEIIREFPASEPEKRADIAWALSKSSQFTVDNLLKLLVDDNARRWVAYIIGNQDQERYISQIEALKTKDPEVYFAVTVLWQIMSSWVYNLEEYG